ncbi:MAG: hypothetical protein KGI38_12025 [Thaumarchaeota archaeon]|nr:hypothetical protein [Nitrososphaerota archaeon]
MSSPQRLGIRPGKPDPEAYSFVDDNGMRHIVFPQGSINLTFGGFSGIHCVTYHPYEGEVWLWETWLSDMLDWEVISLCAVTLKADYSIGLRIRGANQHNKGRFSFEVLL